MSVLSVPEDVVNAETMDSNVGLWSEFLFIMFFALSFALLRLKHTTKKPSKKSKSQTSKIQTSNERSLSHVAIDAKIAENDVAGTVAAWRAEKKNTMAPFPTFRAVVDALFTLEPKTCVKELIDHIKTYPSELGDAKAAQTVLEAVAQSRIGAYTMETTWKQLQVEFQLTWTAQIREAMLGGYAHAGDLVQFEALRAQMKDAGKELSARSFSTVIRGFQAAGMTEPALNYMVGMANAGHQVHPAAVSTLFKAAREEGTLYAAFERIVGTIILPTAAVASILELCLKLDDFNMARRVQKAASDSKTNLNVSAYDSLLKLYASVGDVGALELFAEMQKSGVRISDGLCVGLISRCASPKFHRFAEEVVAAVRKSGKLTLNMYSALMKVYAYARMYAKCCTLYDELLADGLEPDSKMYACLIKFASECGRKDMIPGLCDRPPALDVQSYVQLMRVCGQSGDIDKAYAMFKKVVAAKADAMAYNVFLDVCATAGALGRAREFIREMPAEFIDSVTYNTLLKGYCAAGDDLGAKQVVSEMEAAGCPPGITTYNCILNMQVSAGKIADAWRTVKQMGKSDVIVDKYTVATMMKAVKHSDDPGRALSNALELVDRSDVVITDDEVLFVTTLDACCRQKKLPRIADILQKYEKASSANRSPPMHTNALLIKAYGLTGQIPKCWGIWRSLVEERALAPSDIVIGCMLDVLVRGGCVKEAVALMRDVKSKGCRVNAVMYSTLVKGYVSQKDAAGALELFGEMRDEGVQANNAIYNGVIDAQARIGNTDKVIALVESMQSAGLEPDGTTYSTIVKAYCVRGDLDAAVKLVYDMAPRWKSPCSAYNTVLDACIKANMLELSARLVNDLEKCHVVPTNFTLGSHIKHYGRTGEISKAIEVVESWKTKYGLTANSAVMSCLMRACMGGGAIEHGTKIFRELMASSQGLEATAYRSVVISCTQGKLLGDAVVLIEVFFNLPHSPHRALPCVADTCNLKIVAGGNNQAPDPELAEIVLSALLKHGENNVAATLMKKLQAGGVPVTARIKSQVITHHAAPWNSRE